MMVKNYLPPLLMKKVSEWKEKAKNESNPFNKYFTLYVAYNIVYGYFGENRFRDRDNADRIVRKIENPEKFIGSIEGLLEEYLHLIPVFREEYWDQGNERIGSGIDAQLKKAYQERNYEETLRQLNRWLYKVRCNLFHGDKYLEPEQEKIALLSSGLLESIIDEILKTSQS